MSITTCEFVAYTNVGDVYSVRAIFYGVRIWDIGGGPEYQYGYVFSIDGVDMSGGSLQFTGPGGGGIGTSGAILPGIQEGVPFVFTIKEYTVHLEGAFYVKDDLLSSDSFVYTVHRPTAPISPIPADGSINVVWDDILKWDTNDTFAEDGPYTLSSQFIPLPSLYLYQYYVYIGKNPASLTHIIGYSADGPILPRDTKQYTLQLVNDWWFGLSDYLTINPYYNTTVYVKIRAYNQWGYGETTWSFTIAPEGYNPPSEPPDSLPVYPPTRPEAYAPDDFWIPGEWDGDTYTPPEWGGPTPGRYFATGGGRWSQQLIAIGHGKIYYEELT